MTVFLISDLDAKFGLAPAMPSGGQIPLDKSGSSGKKRKGLLYGSGCSRGGPDCFTCPLPDCEYDIVTEYFKRK